MSWERHVAALTSKVVSGGAILPIQPDGPASARKSIMCALCRLRISACASHHLSPATRRSYAQKGVSLRLPEASALVEAVMDGKVHKDYVVVGGSQSAPSRMD